MLYDSTWLPKDTFRYQSLILPCQASSAHGLYRYCCNIVIAFSHWVGVTDAGLALNVFGFIGVSSLVVYFALEGKTRV
jgi:hypothetical protein